MEQDCFCGQDCEICSKCGYPHCECECEDNDSCDIEEGIEDWEE